MIEVSVQMAGFGSKVLYWNVCLSIGVFHSLLRGIESGSSSFERSKSGQVLKHTVEICQCEAGVRDTLLVCYFGRNTFDPRLRHNTVPAVLLLMTHSRHSLSTNSHTRAKDDGLPGDIFD